MIPEEAAESTGSPSGLFQLFRRGFVCGGFFDHLFDARDDGVCAFADFRIGIDGLDVFEEFEGVLVVFWRTEEAQYFEQDLLFLIFGEGGIGGGGVRFGAEGFVAFDAVLSELFADLVEARFEAELFVGAGGVGRIEFADLAEFSGVVFRDNFFVDVSDCRRESFCFFDARSGFCLCHVFVAGETDLAQVIEVFDVSGGAAGLVAGLGVGTSFSVGEEDGGVALDLELFAEAGVLFDGFGLHLALDFGGLREVEFEEHKLLGCSGFELGFGENFVPQLDAPPAPVGAGEIHENVFGLGFRGELGLFEIHEPSFAGERVAEEEGCDGDDARERTCLHGLLNGARGRPSARVLGSVLSEGMGMLRVGL
ncbi:MAG: hypothetical protein RIS92_231 [Verrucomicrobiota bacterium]